MDDQGKVETTEEHKITGEDTEVFMPTQFSVALLCVPLCPLW